MIARKTGLNHQDTKNTEVHQAMRCSAKAAIEFVSLVTAQTGFLGAAWCLGGEKVFPTILADPC
jgi:hypothetical protein